MKFLLFSLKWALVGLGAAVLLAAALTGSGFAPELSARFHAWLPAHGAAEADGFADAVALAAPAVVSVVAMTRSAAAANPLLADPLIQRFFGAPTPPSNSLAESSLGSGVIIDRAGIVLTNYHVIRGAYDIRVMLADGRVAGAEVTGTDPDTDLAVLRITLDELPEVRLADSDALRVGDIVLAIGNPLGIGQTVTQGIVSATGRNRIGMNVYENFIQTDAAINFGNSGGALVDARGALVGINSVRLESDGIGFAIPTNIAIGVARQILASGSVRRGYIGIDARDLTESLRKMLHVDNGIVVEAVLTGGPADTAGIRPGDVITAIDDTPVDDSRSALALIARLRPGAQVTVTGVRESREYQTAVTVSRRPPPPP